MFCSISFASVPTQASSFVAARFFPGHLRTCTGTPRADPNLTSLLLYAHRYASHARLLGGQFCDLCRLRHAPKSNRHIPGSPRLLHFMWVACQRSCDGQMHDWLHPSGSLLLNRLPNTSNPYIHAQSRPKLSDRHLYQLIRNVKSI